MSESFDPYHKWLGISSSEQPPNHYRLLGLERFEGDPDVIDSAADSRLTHLRTFQTGKHSELSQKLMNEVAAARVRLLNPEKKAEYDRALKAKQHKSSKRRLPVAKPLEAETKPASPIGHGQPQRTGSGNIPRWLPLAVGGGVAALLLVFIASFIIW